MEEKKIAYEKSLEKDKKKVDEVLNKKKTFIENNLPFDIDKDGNLVVPDSPNAYKFEAFLFDAFGKVDEMAVLRVKREEEFAPVKNADSAGVDCPRTARELYKKFYNLDQ